MSVTVKRVDRKSSQRFYELIVETAEVTVRVPFTDGTTLTILRNRSTDASTRRIDRETFHQDRPAAAGKPVRDPHARACPRHCPGW